MKKHFLTLLFISFLGSVFAQPCTDLFISEYLEGSSNNKAVEIYNPTPNPINLSNYKLMRSNNGSPTYQDSLFLSGTIAPGGVYVAGNPSAVIDITNVSDTLHTITFFNGDDVIHLVKNVTTVIDVVGELGVDPGTNWPVGAGATSEYTLVRMATVQQGTTSWTTGATQWDVYPQNTYTYLGSHTMNPCAVINDTVVSFNPNAGTYNEGQNFNLTATLVNPSPVTSFQVTAVLKSGTSADVNGFTSQVLTFPVSGTTASTTITITDDPTQEGAEVLTFALRNPTGGMILGNDTIFTLNINASDAPISVYPIGTVRGNDANGEPDSVNVECYVGGVVYGVNTRTTGLQFFINDHTGGIGVFSPSNTFGYTVTEGDSVIVKGEVDAFNGFGQMGFLDTVILVSTGNTLRTPQIVTSLGEDTESELVRINNVYLASPSQWTGSPSGFNVDITNGTQTYQMRVAPNTTVVSMPAPTGTFHVVGMGAQFDSSSPYDAGYQIQPRYMEDIIPLSNVNEEENVNVSLYPNPTKGNLNITVGVDLKNAQIEVLDMTGKLVFSKIANNLMEGQTFTINLSDKSNGVYMVRVKGDTYQVTRRIVLNK